MMHRSLVASWQTMRGPEVVDYVCKQKLGGTSLSYFVLKQLPLLTPQRYTDPDLRYLVPRVLELVFTSHDMRPFADDLYTGADDSLRTAIQLYAADRLLNVVRQVRELFWAVQMATESQTKGAFRTRCVLMRISMVSPEMNCATFSIQRMFSATIFRGRRFVVPKDKEIKAQPIWIAPLGGFGPQSRSLGLGESSASLSLWSGYRTSNT